MESHPHSLAISLSLPHCIGQGWFPVILALCANVCCSISTSIKLFLSCSAVTESTAHDCRPGGFGINHSDWAKLCTSMCAWVCVCMCMCHWSLFLWVTIGYEEHSFRPLDPGNANGLAKRFAGKWGIEEPFHSLSSSSTYISPPPFPIPWEDMFMDVDDFHLDVRNEGE